MQRKAGNLARHQNRNMCYWKPCCALQVSLQGDTAIAPPFTFAQFLSLLEHTKHVVLKTCIFLLRVTCISVIIMIQVHCHVMLATFSTSTRLEKAGGTLGWKPGNPSHEGCSGRPKAAHINTSNCPSSSVFRIPFFVLPNVTTTPTVLHNFTLFQGCLFL